MVILVNIYDMGELIYTHRYSNLTPKSLFGILVHIFVLAATYLVIARGYIG